MNAPFTKSYLLERLKMEGLPNSYLTLLRLEKEGVIPEPKEKLQVGLLKWRVYSPQEVDRIIAIMKKRQASRP